MITHAILYSVFTFSFISLGDSAELWVTLNAMGYDYNLVQDEAALFKVTI